MYEWSPIVIPMGINNGMIGISELENPNGAKKNSKIVLILIMGVKIKNIQQIH